MLDIVASYHCMQFQGKHMIQTQGNDQKTHFGPDLGPLGPNSGHQFFFQNLASSVARYYSQQYQKKLMIQSRENLVTDGRTDGQTDESDFIGRCPTNVERSK